MTQLIATARSCRSCDASPLTTVFDLGVQPLANGLRRADSTASEPRYPLALALCTQCSLAQLTVSVPPQEMFASYPYFSSVSDAVVEHAKANVDLVLRSQSLGPQSLVVEIGSNDGYLLHHYQSAGIPVLGIEPAENIAAVANKRGIPTACEYFGVDTAARLASKGSRADVIHANNVMAHIPDLNGVLEGLRRMLKENGKVIIETPYVKDLLENREFDTIYHEHLYYYSLTAIDSLFARHGLTVEDVDRIGFHGGSLRVTAGHAGGSEVEPSVPRLLAEEVSWGVRTTCAYEGLASAVRQLGAELRDMLEAINSSGKRIVAYGAAAKGATLLNTFDIGRSHLEYVVDRSPHKQGMVMPGSRLDVRHPDLLVTDRPDYVLLLTWNLADEILAQQAAYRATGGRFIIPIPSPSVI